MSKARAFIQKSLLFIVALCNPLLAGANEGVKVQSISEQEMELNSKLAEAKLRSGHQAAQNIADQTICSPFMKKLSFQFSKGMISPDNLVQKLSKRHQKISTKNKKTFPEFLHVFSICWTKYEQGKGETSKNIFNKSQTLFSNQTIMIGKQNALIQNPEKGGISAKKAALIGTGIAGAAFVGINVYRHRYLFDETYDLFAGTAKDGMQSFKKRFGSYRSNLRSYRNGIDHLNPMAKNVKMCCKGSRAKAEKELKNFVDSSPSIMRRLYKVQSWMDGDQAPYSTLAVIMASSALWTLAIEHVDDKKQKESSQKLMGLTLGALGLVKMLNVTGTATRLSKYDLLIQSSSSSGRVGLARAGFSYALLYPYIEALIGVSYLSGINETASHVATIITQGATALGALMIVIDGTKILCGCNGASSKMKVSWVTFTESMAMVAMAAYGLIQDDQTEKTKLEGWNLPDSKLAR